MHRQVLRDAGISRHDIRSEVTAGRWRSVGRHTVFIGTGGLGQEDVRCRAVWESGAGAVLDGVSALQQGGLKGFVSETVHVAMPMGNRFHRLEGVTLHRRRDLGPTIGSSPRRATPEWAVVRAGEWAATDRTAALIVCLAVQQRLVHPGRLSAAGGTVRRSRRRDFLDAVIPAVCDGAHSLGELDLGSLCRRRGIPPPDRQVVRRTQDGRIYLDAVWDDVGLVVEVDGGHHALALNPVDDAFRANEVVIGRECVLRLPVLALHLDPDRCLDQIERAREMLRRKQ